LSRVADLSCDYLFPCKTIRGSERTAGVLQKVVGVRL